MTWWWQWRRRALAAEAALEKASTQRDEYRGLAEQFLAERNTAMTKLSETRGDLAQAREQVRRMSER